MTPIRVPPNIDRIEPYVPGKPIEEVERELGLTNTIKLASNENPLGPSPRALEAISAAIGGVNRYPDGSGYYLKKRLGRIHQLPIEQVLLGNGSTDLVEILARTFLGADGTAVMADQAFIMYRIAVMAVNGNARVVPLRRMRHDLPAMADRIDSSTRLVFIANPNNPTGTCVTHREMVEFLDRVPEGTLVVVDEAYKEYVLEPDYPDTLSLLKQGRRLAILRTFSKIYGLAGLRLGYAMTTADVAASAEKVRSPFNTSSVAQAAGLAALDDQGHVARSREHNERERGFLQTELSRRGIPFTPSAANFVLVDTGRDAERVFALMLGAGVIVRPMRSYNLPTCIRVSVGTHEENLLFLSALELSLASTLSRNASD
ncbi:MAG TPA: histidinol-phosphate transaminase [Candidatus Polarisedimenticolia bacterium]